MLLSDDQIAIRDMVRTFAQDRILPQSLTFEKRCEFPRELFEEMGQLGLWGMTAPESEGGAGADYVSYALSLMEIAAADGALSTIVSIQNSLVVAALVKGGTELQKSRFLPDLLGGRAIGAFALTEGHAGSDAGAIRTRARKVDGGWRLNGSKQFISSGKIASLTIVYAVSDPTAGKRGITGFLVPTDSLGYHVDKVEHKLGQSASDTCAIRFEDLFVEDALQFGREGGGYSLALSNLETGRIGIAAQSVGMAQAALQIAVSYAKGRESFGQPILEHQAVGHRLADLATQLEASRQMVLHAASLKDAGTDCLKEASMAKLFASEAAERIISGALQTLGGYGYIEESGIAKIYRDARVCQIYEGTSDILRMVIARQL